MTKLRDARLLLWCLLLLAACSSTRTRPEATASVDEGSLDRTFDPCDDFYQFACGNWIKNTPIPPDRARWVRSFSEIDKRNETRLLRLLEAAAVAKGPDDDARKLGVLHASCIDEAAVERNSAKALGELLAPIDALKDKKDLPAVVAALQQQGVPALFSFRQQQDFKDAKEVIGGADQGGLGLPDRDMYEEPKFEQVRKAYLEHTAAELQLAGESPEDSQAHARKVMAVETALAKVSLPRAARRKPENVYHRIERAGLVAAAPSFDWTAYFAAIGQPELQAINVATPEFFAGLNQQLDAVPLDDWKVYLRARAIDHAADRLGQAFVDEKFHFTSAAFTGAKEDLPRWKKCVAFADQAMGQALGRLFVKESFGDQSKSVAKQMIQDIEMAFEKNLVTVAWMDPAAREASLDKLHKVFNKVGFADKWRDYSKLQVSDSYLGNALAAARFENDRQLSKIGKPLDRTDWGMTPPQVNAYYNSSLNEMVFPAGILQTPFFALTQDDATNYGAIGYVMGHELTHGFDDRGRRFDGDGNLREWWTPEVGKAYEERAECVANQYDEYTVLNGDMHLNGHLTLGENIADIGGLKLAYRAWKLHQGDRPPGPKVAGFSDDQRFFLSAAQVWCMNTRDEQARTRVKTDSHSPGRYRVIGPLVDDPDFAAAFQCKAGSKMAPEKRCEVW